MSDKLTAEEWAELRSMLSNYQRIRGSYEWLAFYKPDAMSDAEQKQLLLKYRAREAELPEHQRYRRAESSNG